MYVFSTESGIVTLRFPAKVPVNLITSFLPFDTAPFVKVKALLALVTLKASYPPIACSKINKFVFVIAPQVPEFYPVACTVNFKLADVEFAIF